VCGQEGARYSTGGLLREEISKETTEERGGRSTRQKKKIHQY